MVSTSVDRVFRDQWMELFYWAHTESKNGNIIKANKLFKVVERLSERRRAYNNTKKR